MLQATRDTTQFYSTDHNIAASICTGFYLSMEYGSNHELGYTKYTTTPNPLLATGGCVAPSDGFFTPVNYRGAFAPGQKSWLSDWSYATLLGTTSGLQPCPTDINGDGVTNNVDFLILLGQFNHPAINFKIYI